MEADLGAAYIEGINLRGANLGAHLTEAVLGDTNFKGLDMTRTRLSEEYS